MNVSGPQKPTWGYVCALTLRYFRMQFQVYFPAGVLACACAYCCYYGLEWISSKLVISRSFENVMEPEHLALQRFAYAIGRVSIWSVQVWIVWLAFTFVLATFAVKMLQDRRSTGSPMKISEAFQLVRSGHLGPLVGISALAGAATALFSIFLVPLLLRALPLLLIQLDLFENYLVAFKWASAALILLSAAVLTKMALAVPELVDDQNASFGGSIRNSIKATAGWELFFVLNFGVVGLAGGILYTAGSSLLEQSWKNGQLSSAGHGILLAAFTIILTALAITLLAITYSILYVALRYGHAETMSGPAELPC